ncbi:MAG TPA: NAD(P)H-quinone oxidoreductase [Pyrinomonadaceae bacterium]|jgi:putative PIG3 family NAD(P)H quinone oxidoreductase|nr:NAD(P)H-quinone oxidoreductase [Pyrinomonadaceae bacterium]
MSEEKMRAVRIVSHEGAGRLEVCEVARPVATADRVRVRVRAAGLNRADLLQKRGRYPAPPGAVADIPGLEFAGEVEQTGDEVRTLKTGQRVFGITAGGAQAEYVSVPESHLALIPDALDFRQAAAVPEVFITAHDALFTQARFQAGERVLVHAVGSGVGTAAVQLARAAGAGAVYGTARTSEKVERAREFGMDDGIVVGEDAGVFAEAVSAWTRGAGVQVVLDLVGASYLDANLDALGHKGRMILIGTLGGSSAPLDFGRVMRKRLRVAGTMLRGRTPEEKAAATRRFAAHVVPLLAQGRLRPVIDSTHALAQVSAAYERLESNETFGKVVLVMSDEQ